MTKATSKKTHLTVGVLTVSEGWFTTFTGESTAAGGRAAVVLSRS